MKRAPLLQTTLVALASAAVLCGSMAAIAAETAGTQPSPPNPPGLELPPLPPLPPPTAVRRAPSPPRNTSVPGATSSKAVPSSSLPAVPVAQASIPPDVLAFDSKEKSHQANPGDTSAQILFAVTNKSTADVMIMRVRPSCGCTVAKLPSDPWTLVPGAGGNIALTVDLRGKSGNITKSATVYTSAGQATLRFHVQVPGPAAAAATPAARLSDRQKNMQIAAADRQAVFRNDCATCHVAPAVGKKGRELFEAACAICHAEEHRASFVPNLQALNKPTHPEYWSTWISFGREGSLMPAFAAAKGGPLDGSQIQSLVEYLEGDFKAISSPLQTTPAVRPKSPAPGLPAGGN